MSDRDEASEHRPMAAAWGQCVDDAVRSIRTTGRVPLPLSKPRAGRRLDTSSRRASYTASAYSHFVSTLTQSPTIETLFPIEPPEAEEADEREVVFEPSPDQILETLLQKYVQNRMYAAWLDVLAGEHAARMTAMDSATKNAGEMIDNLQLFYNRSRQAAITKELIEIISGSESL